jgi:hypothetical protein
MTNKNIKLLFCFIVLPALFVACKKNDDKIDDFASKYKYPIEAVKLSKDALIGAYYSNYTSTDWNKVQPDTSLLGKPYNAITNHDILPQQMNWADEGGVDYLIFKWNAATDNSLLDAFVSARSNQKVKMVIDYNTAHLKATNAAPLKGAVLKTMLNEFTSLVQSYISKDYYFKIGDRPVILLSPINLSSSALTSIDYKYVTDTLRTELKKQGINPFFIGELTTGWAAPVNYDATALAAMDAIVLTSWNTPDYDRWWAFYSFVDLSYQNWKKSLEQMNVQYVPCIFPGYNEPNGPTQRIIDRTDSNYVDYCNVAKRSMGKDQLIIINSWNDFSRGTALEPSLKYNKHFLEITKREFKVQ